MTDAVREGRDTRGLRVGSLNLRAYPNPGRDQIHRLAQVIAAHDCDVVLLQECLGPWLDVVCEATGMEGIHSHTLDPPTPRGDFSPDGCAIAVRPPLRFGQCRRIAPESFMPDAVGTRIPEEAPAGFEPMPERLTRRYSGRSILAEVLVDGRSFIAGSFHATPGTGKVGGQTVHEWKPFFHGAVAAELADLETPFVFGIDANEPLAETADSITFHWQEGRSGVEKLRALLGLEPMHRGRDLFREWFGTTEAKAASDTVLHVTYTTGESFQRRFDSLWATPEFRLAGFSVHSEEVVAAGGDHALLVADLRLDGPQD